MAGLTVPDTDLGRDSVRRAFAWMLGEMKQGQQQEIVVEIKGHNITFRHFPKEQK